MIMIITNFFLIAKIKTKFRYQLFFLTWHFARFLLDINECLNSSCGNNADCLDLPGGFKCHCKEDFTGKDCNISKFRKLKTMNLLDKG